FHAAINSGNSGGPVIMGDRVVGVAFESLFWSDGIGYIIPTTVVKHFLNGVEQHVSFGSVNLSYQTMENAQIREYYKMSDEMTGILINEINPFSDAHKFLKKDDVILAIDGVSIGNDSKVHFRKQETITFKHLVSMKKPCETALVKVLREGKEHEFNISVKPVQPLVPTQHFDKHRSYCIYGGVVLVALTKPYIDSSYISESFLGKMPKKAVEQIVIISQAKHKLELLVASCSASRCSRPQKKKRQRPDPPSSSLSSAESLEALRIHFGISEALEAPQQAEEATHRAEEAPK
ncbi:hypothetical protein EUTSA_v10019498mg, partial [Eutrema salsugineum]